MEEAKESPVEASSEKKSTVESYDATGIRKPESVADLGRDVLSLHHVYGYDLGRRGNLHLIEDDRIIYATSSAVVLENIVNGKKDYILGIDENGVGCVVVHPTKKFFAVGGRGFMPNIYVYSYPDLKVSIHNIIQQFKNFLLILFLLIRFVRF